MDYTTKGDKTQIHKNESRGASIGYMPGLDGLRALAVFAVIAYHFGLTWAPGGLLGVCLFFVLSGYLITNILLLQWKNNGKIDLKDFWIRRARRLLPAFFAMLVGVMFWIIYFAPERFEAIKYEALASTFYTSNWYLIFHEVSYFERFGPPSPLGHLWSLAVEEQFYLFWPLILGFGFLFLKQRKWIIWGTVAIALISCIAMALIYIPGSDPSRVYYGTDTRAFSLLSGAVLAMVLPSSRMTEPLSGKNKLALDVTGSIGLLVVIFMILNTNQYQTFLYRGGLLIFSIAAAILVAAIANPSFYMSKLFAWRPIRWLGECSYGIYLWHYPIVVLTSPVVNTGGTKTSLMLWQILMTIILAVLSRYLIEEPIRYGRQKSSFHQRVHVFQSWNRPLALSIKISAGTLLIFLILITNANKGIQVSAKDFEEIHSKGIQVAEEQSKGQSQETQEQTQGQAQETHEQSQGKTQEQTQLPDANDDQEVASNETMMSGDGITVIGDSLMIDVTPVLQEYLPGIIVDAKISRQMHQAADVIMELKKANKLGEIVILQLGTNGSFTEKQLMETLDQLEGTEKIILINARVPRPWEAVVNETLSKVTKSYDNIKLIDWHSASAGHDDYFRSDGVHLESSGVEAYAEIIIETLM